MTVVENWHALYPSIYFSWRLPESSASIQPVFYAAEQLLSVNFQEQLYVLYTLA